MRFPEPTYEHCLITGASAGLGAEFARQLATRARLLTLVARREDRLEDLAESLRSGAPDLRCEVIPIDLASPGGPAALRDEMARRELPAVHLLVNNAGFGRVGAFAEFSWEEYRQMFNLNMSALADLLYHLLEDLQSAPGRGAINVASAAGFQPIPYFAPYSATKAFVRSLSAALAQEVRPSGTRILSLCPGPVETEFATVAGLAGGFTKPAASAEEVVGAALRAYEKGKIEVIPGLINRMFAFSGRFAPLKAVTAISARVMASRTGR